MSTIKILAITDRVVHSYGAHNGHSLRYLTFKNFDSVVKQESVLVSKNLRFLDLEVKNHKVQKFDENLPRRVENKLENNYYGVLYTEQKNKYKYSELYEKSFESTLPVSKIPYINLLKDKHIKTKKNLLNNQFNHSSLDVLTSNFYKYQENLDVIYQKNHIIAEKTRKINYLKSKIKQMNASKDLDINFSGNGYQNHGLYRFIGNDFKMVNNVVLINTNLPEKWFGILTNSLFLNFLKMNHLNYYCFNFQESHIKHITLEEFKSLYVIITLFCEFSGIKISLKLLHLYFGIKRSNDFFSYFENTYLKLFDKTIKEELHAACLLCQKNMVLLNKNRLSRYTYLRLLKKYNLNDIPQNDEFILNQNDESLEILVKSLEETKFEKTLHNSAIYNFYEKNYPYIEYSQFLKGLSKNMNSRQKYTKDAIVDFFKKLTPNETTDLPDELNKLIWERIHSNKNFESSPNKDSYHNHPRINYVSGEIYRVKILQYLNNLKACVENKIHHFCNNEPKISDIKNIDPKILDHRLYKNKTINTESLFEYVEKTYEDDVSKWFLEVSEDLCEEQRLKDIESKMKINLIRNSQSLFLLKRKDENENPLSDESADSEYEEQNPNKMENEKPKKNYYEEAKKLSHEINHCYEDIVYEHYNKNNKGTFTIDDLFEVLEL
jgi:hypothetical protein